MDSLWKIMWRKGVKVMRHLAPVSNNFVESFLKFMKVIRTLKFNFLCFSNIWLIVIAQPALDRLGLKFWAFRDFRLTSRSRWELLFGGYYSAGSGNSLPTFRYNVSVPSSRLFLDSLPLQMGPISCPETSVRNYNYSLRNNPDKGSSHLYSELLFN
jgi:hypothetical protein